MNDTLHVTADMLKDQPLMVHSSEARRFNLYGDPILTIRPNGVIEIAKGYTPSEAGEAVLAYVREHWANEESCRRIRELEERVKRLDSIGHAMAERLASKVAKCSNCDGSGQNHDGEGWVNEACPRCEEDRIVLSLFDDLTKQSKP